MKIDYIENGVIDAIVAHLSSTEKGTETAVLQLNAVDGSVAAALKTAGFKSYHGTNGDGDVVASLKKDVKGYSRRFHVIDLFDGKAFEKKHDVVICLNGTPYKETPTGTSMIVATSGVGNFESVCAIVAPLFETGAKTVQHDDVFITYGTRV